MLWCAPGEQAARLAEQRKLRKSEMQRRSGETDSQYTARLRALGLNPEDIAAAIEQTALFNSGADGLGLGDTRGTGGARQRRHSFTGTVEEHAHHAETAKCVGRRSVSSGPVTSRVGWSCSWGAARASVRLRTGRWDARGEAVERENA